MDDYARLLQGLTLPAICCNPDKQMLTPSGLQPAPGAIAALY
jgi:ribonucleotide monophosphatase NagD (HAD superfamily)